MRQVVYADLLFLVNFSMDFLCLFVSARLLHRPVRKLGFFAASVLGGVYSVAILFVEINAFWSIIIDAGSCALMCMLAFGVKDGGAYRFFVSFAVFFGVCAGTGGFMTAMYNFLNRMNLPLDSVENNGDEISVWMFGLLAIASGCIASFGGKIFKTVSKDTVLRIDVKYMGKEIRLFGMVDTGNLLSDPISAKPIIVVDSKRLTSVLTSSCIDSAIRGDINTIFAEDPSHRVRIIPISTAGGRAMMCAFVPDKVMLTIENNENKKGAKEKSYSVEALFAPAELEFDVNKKAEGCSALIPPSLIS